MPRILVTRPEPGASQTAEKLAAMGMEPVLLPLSEIVSLTPVELPHPQNFAVVAVTSPNAARHLPARLAKSITHLPVFAVGEASGRAAREAGLRPVDESAGDAEGLARRIIDARAPGAGILVLTGRVRRGILEKRLRQAGLNAHVVETYDTIARPPTEEDFIAALNEIPVDVVLLYSAMAAAIFADLAKKPRTLPLLGRAASIAISQRVADMLSQSARERTRVAAEPTEEAMLSLLAE